MKPGIGTLAIVGVAVVTAAVIGVMSGLLIRAHQAAFIDQLTRSADQLSETIASTTYYDMLENRRDAVHREIATIGRQRGIERVRLFNATGTVMFSSDEGEIGRAVDKKGEACDACHAAGQPLQRLPIHARARIYRAADRQIAHDRGQLILLAALAIAASSLLLWGLSRALILRPVEALVAGTRRVAQGDLSTAVPATARHELGDLARAFNDMTARLRDSQRQLAQADKLASVGRLAAGVAHEINNPLTGVLTYASYLEKRAGGDAETRADLGVIVRETKRCREIVRGLLDFARQTPPRRQPTDLNEVVRRARTIVTNQLALSHVQVDLDLAEGLAPVPADANQLQQVVVNLLLNAADAISGGEAPGGAGGAAGNASGNAAATAPDASPPAGGGSVRVRTSALALPARGNAVVRRAACPKGCDLLDPASRVAGQPAIRALRRANGRDVVVRLDPVYGRGNHHASEPCEEGTIAVYLCPVCRTHLDRAERRCDLCGAPMFGVRTGGRGTIEWCTRKGCPGTRWEAMDALGPRLYAQLEVEDSGRGIAPEEMDRLFEPFFTTKGTRGTGLGLAVTWGIVEGHGGSISVESEPCRGTRFAVRLPFDVVEGAEVARPVPMPDARGRAGGSRS